MGLHTLQTRHLHATAAAWASPESEGCDLAPRVASLFLAEWFRVAISRFRERGNVRQSACQDWHHLTRFGRRRRITRSTTDAIFANRAAAFSAGHRYDLRHLSSN